MTKRKNNFIMLPTVDFCFKELMQNPKVRKGFIAALLNLPPEKIADTLLMPTILQEQRVSLAKLSRRSAAASAAIFLGRKVRMCSEAAVNQCHLVKARNGEDRRNYTDTQAGEVPIGSDWKGVSFNQTHDLHRWFPAT